MNFPGYKKIRELLAVARGEQKAELLLKNCRGVDFFKGETFTTSVAISHGIITGIGDYSGIREINCEGKYLVPGFIDGHIHIESSHLLPSYFGEAAITHGTTTIFTDPHEIANALGKKGILFFMKNARLSPIDIFFLIPSCVPAIKLWDIYGNEITPEDIGELLEEENVIGLAEMMNFPGVINGDKEVWKKLEKAWDRLKDGHVPLVSGSNLNAYLIGNIGSDHESSQVKEALEKISKGMFLMVREGSAAKNLEILPEVINTYNGERIALVSDDLLASDLLKEGHIDRILRLARKRYQIDPYLLIKMVTFNPAWYFGLRDRGIVAPGKVADLAILNDLEDFKVVMVIKNGNVVYEKGKIVDKKAPRIPRWVKKSVKLKPLNKDDFAYKCKGNEVKAIEIIPDQILTREIKLNVERRRGNIVAQPQNDIVKIAAIDRYSGNNHIALGLVKGTGMKKGAIASTYAHDTHNLIVMGVTEEEMAIAAERVRKMGGGMVVVSGNKILEELPLPVGGVVSDLPAEEVASRTERLNNAARELGFTIKDPFVTLSFLSLTVIPELKITPVGLVNLTKMEKTRC